MSSRLLRNAWRVIYESHKMLAVHLVMTAQLAQEEAAGCACQDASRLVLPVIIPVMGQLCSTSEIQHSDKAIALSVVSLRTTRSKYAVSSPHVRYCDWWI